MLSLASVILETSVSNNENLHLPFSSPSQNCSSVQLLCKVEAKISLPGQQVFHVPPNSFAVAISFNVKQLTCTIVPFAYLTTVLGISELYSKQQRHYFLGFHIHRYFNCI